MWVHFLNLGFYGVIGLLGKLLEFCDIREGVNECF